MKRRSILSHGHEWTSVCRDVGEKCPNVIDESNETLPPLPNTGYLVRIDMNSFFVDYVPEAVYSVCI